MIDPACSFSRNTLGMSETTEASCLRLTVDTVSVLGRFGLSRDRVDRPDDVRRCCECPGRLGEQRDACDAGVDVHRGERRVGVALVVAEIAGVAARRVEVVDRARPGDGPIPRLPRDLGLLLAGEPGGAERLIERLGGVGTLVPGRLEPRAASGAGGLADLV